MKIEIKHRWTNACLWSGEIEDQGSDQANLGTAVKAALAGGANLAGANLVRANLPDGFRVARLDFGGWPILVMPEWTRIGCQKHPNSEWLKWEPESEQIAKMHSDAPAWWARHKDSIRAVIRDVMVATA